MPSRGCFLLQLQGVIVTVLWLLSLVFIYCAPELTVTLTYPGRYIYRGEIDLSEHFTHHVRPAARGSKSKSLVITPTL
jgi:hypothetical protein